MSTLSTGPDRLRTILLDVDFNVSSSDRTTFSKDKVLMSQNSIRNLSVSTIANSIPECRVVLNDIFSSGQTEQFKTLKNGQDKNHSAPSRQPTDNIYLETLSKKEPIAWPSMKDTERWNRLDDSVQFF